MQLRNVCRNHLPQNCQFRRLPNAEYSAVMSIQQGTQYLAVLNIKQALFQNIAAYCLFAYSTVVSGRCVRDEVLKTSFLRSLARHSLG